MYPPIKIVILEDQQIFRFGLRSYFSNRNDFEVLGEASSLRDLHTLLARETPDILLADLHLSDTQGAPTVDAIVRRYPDLKVLVLSNEQHPDHVLAAVRAGALGYVIKDASVQELIIAIKALAGGNSYFSHQISGCLLGKIGSRRPRRSDPTGPRITKRERQILEFTYHELTNHEIAAQLLISPRTVDTHKRNLMRKLRVKNSVGLVKYYLRSRSAV